MIKLHANYYTLGIDSFETSLSENEVNVNKSNLVFQVDSPTSNMLVHNNDVAVADIKVIYKYGARSLPSVEKLDKNETTPSIPTTAVNLINGNNVYAIKLSKRAKLRAMMKRLVKKIAKAIAKAVKPVPTLK